MASTASLEEHLAAVRDIVGSLETGNLTGSEAALLATCFAAGERACAAGKALCAKRVAETRHYEREGHKDPASWLAETSGDSHKKAKDVLQSAACLEGSLLLSGAFRSGELSSDKASEISRALTEDALAGQELLETARRGSLRELRTRADAICAAARSAEDDEARHARVHARRHLRTWGERDGSFAGRFALTPEDGAVLMGRVDQIANELFDEARRSGHKQPREAYLADALVLLASASRTGSSDPSASPVTGDPAKTAPDDEAAPGNVPAADRFYEPSYEVLMRIDLEALIRGSVGPGEECLIDGTGHVPVSVVQSYLDRAKVRLAVTKGTDVVSVFSFSRTIPTSLRTALLIRDRTCVVPGCTSTFHLEIDHIKEFHKRGPTTLSNLCLLCRYHHSLKSRHQFRLEGGPGTWAWIPEQGSVPNPRSSPADPRSLPDSLRSPRNPQAPDTRMPAAAPREELGAQFESGWFSAQADPPVRVRATAPVLSPP
ncbi:MAG: HNH endonuclease signature motif containing protein [Acidimicrobiales bacterium]